MTNEQLVSDERYMSRALALAESATRRAAPNPGVGCVLVKEGIIIGEGASLAVGEDHAEICAINACFANGHTPKGATVYVTLEPCAHYGRTPPCVDRLIQEQVARVVIAQKDPYYQVAGAGIQRLKEGGIPVTLGVLEQKARYVHRGFLSRIERGRPWVMLKVAGTLDGKTALLNGKSQWITSKAARQDVHRLRSLNEAILTGSKTVILDNPSLTVRDVPSRYQPLRLVLDSQLKTPPTQTIYQSGHTVIITGETDEKRYRPYVHFGCEVVQMDLDPLNQCIDLHKLLAYLGKREINCLMVEAGRTLNGALLKAGLVDEVILYLAPDFIGAIGRGMFDWSELRDLSERKQMDIIDIQKLGRDIRLQLFPVKTAISIE